MTQTDSTAGLVTMTAIAAVGNSRNVAGKRYILDAQIYVGSEKCESLLGALSYFNATDISFDNENFGLYLIYATIAKFHTAADIHPSESSPSKYDFIGNIQWMIPLTSPSKETDISTFAIDPSQPPYLHVSGMAVNCQKQQGTFDVDVEDYISTLKDIKIDSKIVKPSAPISCFIPDSPRYKQGKPVPYNKRYVSVSGFLADVSYKPDSEDIQRFHLRVQDITFLGQQSGATTTVPNSLDSPSPAKTPSRKGFLSYRKPGTPCPTTPVTPTPAQGASRKRARVESESDTAQNMESSA